ncbi:MAG: thermonuclease family protein [Phycisphaerae bacterium]
MSEIAWNPGVFEDRADPSLTVGARLGEFFNEPIRINRPTDHAPWNARLTFGLALAACLFSANVAAWAQDAQDLPRDGRTAVVVEVLPTGQIVIQTGDLEERIDLRGVQLPEPGHALEDAQRFLDNLLRGESVSVEQVSGSGKGKDSRRLAYLRRLPDRLFVNAEIIRQGYARADISEEHPRHDEFRELEARAREAKRGIWRPNKSARSDTGKQPTATRPTPSQKTQASSQPIAAPAGEVVYVTPHGDKYHRADCAHLRGGGQPMPLEKARQKYEPCKQCKPPA